MNNAANNPAHSVTAHTDTAAMTDTYTAEKSALQSLNKNSSIVDILCQYIKLTGVSL